MYTLLLLSQIFGQKTVNLVVFNIRNRVTNMMPDLCDNQGQDIDTCILVGYIVRVSCLELQ